MQFPCSEVTIAGDMLERREGCKQGEESEARDQTAGGQTRYKRKGKKVERNNNVFYFSGKTEATEVKYIECLLRCLLINYHPY